MPNVRPSLDTLVCEAVEMADADARAAYLGRACGDDHALRRQAEALVAAHFQAGSFLEQPACPPAGTAPHTPVAGEADLARPAEGPGTFIGPYKLLERIGEGGMGAVYVAEQARPVRRRVAVKVIKPGMDSTEVVARFEAERQALALMDHPHIAKVLDAGATQAGRPYFVMELVRGLPITEYCDQARLPAGRLLRLFAQVCRAVQHAHQKGVIHRDLKPSNVLVTMHDGEPVPKVIDFGVAKALNQRLTDRTVYTRLAQMIGTPLYMSPEQADLSALDVDTRADVYSLGVLLYELLTGTTPFDPEAFRKAGFDEMRRMIREDEPPRPSQRVSTLGAQARSTLSARRGLDDRQLRRLLHGDLDWIAMKALEKDRNRRYESAGAFAADVERYLADKAVEARPPSAWYQARKFVRRNRARLAAAFVLAVAALTAAGSVGWGMWDAAARRSAAARAAAEALADADRWEGSARWPDALAAADRAAAVLSDAGDDGLRAAVRERQAALRLVLRLEEARLEMAAVRGETFDLSLGDRLYAEAFGDYGLDVDAREPEEVARRLPGEPLRSELVAALDDWARVRRETKASGWERPLAVARAADTDPWRCQFREAWARGDRKGVRELAAAAPLDRLHPCVILLLQAPLPSAEAVALLREAQRQRPQDFWLNHTLGLRLFQAKPPRNQEALGFLRAAVALRPNSPGVLNNLGILLKRLGQHDEAVAAYRQAIRLKPGYSTPHNNLALCLTDKGALDEAVQAGREAVRLDPGDAGAHFGLGNALAAKGVVDDAVKAYREALRIKPDYAGAYTNLGHALTAKGALGEAMKAFREALRIDPNLSEALTGLGVALARTGQVKEGIDYFRKAIRLNPNGHAAHANLGKALYTQGKMAEAVKAYREALRIKPNLAVVMIGLAKALTRDGEFEEAIATYRAALRIKPEDADIHLNLSQLHLAMDAWGAAETDTRAALRIRPDFAEAHCNLGHALMGLGQFREALAAFRRGHELGSRTAGWRYPSAGWVSRCEALVAGEELARWFRLAGYRAFGFPAWLEAAPPPRPRP